jgi:tetratricopeptide (TPR) repeat protein
LLFKNVGALGERFLYTPSLGFCMILVLGLASWWERTGQKNTLPYLYLGLGAIVLLGIGKTASHLPVWQNNETLFRYGAEAAPNSFRTHLNLAETLRTKAETSAPNAPGRKQLFQEAQQAYQRSLAIYDGEGTTWYNLGVCYMNLGQPDQARNAFQKAIDMGKQVGSAANNIGVIFFQRNNFPEAARYFLQATEAEPQNANHKANLGLALENSGRLKEAIPLYQEALRLDPNQVLAKQQLGRLGY